MSPSDPLLLALDAGTGSIRAVVFDVAGRQLAIAQREYVHPPVPGVPGGMSFETGHAWELACACIGEVVREVGGADRIAAISATSMREGMVLYDADGAELWACPNADARAGKEIEELIERGDADRIYETAGDWVAITAPPRLRWLARHEPELLGRVRHLTMISDWLVNKLSGRFVTEPTVGSSSALFDLQRRTWSRDLVDRCGLDADVLPTVVEPGAVVGGVTAQAAAETGLREATPVVAGGADTQLGLLGLGVTDPGTCVVLGGTFWQTTVALDAPVIDPQKRLRTLCHVLPAQWMIEGIGFWCGLAMRWVRDALCQEERQIAAAEGVDVYEVIGRLAEQVPPGSNGVRAIFSNVMNARRWVHAAPGFLGVDVTAPERTGKGALARATMEAAAYVVRAHVELLEEICERTIERLIFSGGAARSQLWTQIVADVTNRPVEVPSTTESTALGCALCAGVGAGVWPNLTVAAQSAARHPRRELVPAADAVAAYDGLYREWLALYDHQLEAVLHGLATPLWAAAGATTGGVPA